MESAPNIFISFAAGLLSFLSPCILPLIPSYISFIGGASLEDLKDGVSNRWAVLRRTLFFVLGFSTVFIGLGIVLSGGSILLGGWNLIINLVAGAVVILLGLNFLFDFWKILNIEKRFQVKKKPSGAAGSFLVGMAFGGGWSPCIGPILAAILFLASQSGQLAISVLYLIVYSAGLGLPFVLAAVFFSAFAKNVSKINRYARTIKIVSGILMIAIGISIALGRFQQMNTFFFSTAYSFQQWSDANPEVSRNIFGISFIAVGLLSLAPLSRWVYKRYPKLETSQKKRFPYFLTSIGGILIVLSVLELTQTIRIESLVTAWLTFQGI